MENKLNLFLCGFVARAITIFDVFWETANVKNETNVHGCGDRGEQVPCEDGRMLCYDR